MHTCETGHGEGGLQSRAEVRAADQLGCRLVVVGPGAEDQIAYRLVGPGARRRAVADQLVSLDYVLDAGLDEHARLAIGRHRVSDAGDGPPDGVVARLDHDPTGREVGDFEALDQTAVGAQTQYQAIRSEARSTAVDCDGESAAFDGRLAGQRR